ncbi:MAG TPA: hypothetical protein VK564_12590 [Thermodesulfobacteriota bacterium]|nr:hypothetical protein [Thermodesulfobacteriota bacterium]
MNKKSLYRVLDEMPPEKAIKEIGLMVNKLFPLLEEKARLDFIMTLIGDTQQDKVASLVHL